MRIGIDANEANITSKVGVGQYAYNVLIELYRQDLNNEYHLYLKNPPLSDLPPARKKWTYHIFGPQKLWTKFALPIKLFTQNFHLDFFYSPSHYSPHFSPFPTIPTIHDLGYLQSLDQFNKKDIYQLVNWTKRSIFQSVHIIAVSEFTKTEINRIYHIPLSKISVVPNGVGKIPLFTPKETQKTLTKFKISKPYLLTLGTLKPNKNIPFLLEAFAKTNHNLLVIAGKKGWLFENIFATVKLLSLENRVIFTDYISENEKWILLQNAKASILPSTYEGFGIPAIESISAGTPVIASDIPAFREVIKNNAQLINPNNLSELINALNNIKNITTPKKITNYTWSASAKTLIDTFNLL